MNPFTDLPQILNWELGRSRGMFFKLRKCVLQLMYSFLSEFKGCFVIATFFQTHRWIITKNNPYLVPLLPPPPSFGLMRKLESSQIAPRLYSLVSMAPLCILYLINNIGPLEFFKGPGPFISP